ncbi:hypothetical protein ABEB36_010741 [Hypothenemus hampei]|uniref:Uncharacterized protein n=1 Tax=Hypothenemus hampei TaxID=57062 RepID=A0ABD1ED83_HYPHA
MSSESSTGTDDSLSEAWSEIGSQGGGTPASIKQQFISDDCIKLLKEAQESAQSSCRTSLAGSKKNSNRSSPRTPPNSPVIQETHLNLELQSYYTNSESRKESLPFYWNALPHSIRPKPWRFRAPHNHEGRGICIMLLTNIFSLIFGTGAVVFLNHYGLCYSVSATNVLPVIPKFSIKY